MKEILPNIITNKFSIIILHIFTKQAFRCFTLTKTCILSAFFERRYTVLWHSLLLSFLNIKVYYCSVQFKNTPLTNLMDGIQIYCICVLWINVKSSSKFTKTADISQIENLCCTIYFTQTTITIFWLGVQLDQQPFPRKQQRDVNLERV